MKLLEMLCRSLCHKCYVEGCYEILQESQADRQDFF